MGSNAGANSRWARVRKYAELKGLSVGQAQAMMKELGREAVDAELNRVEKRADAIVEQILGQDKVSVAAIIGVAKLVEAYGLADVTAALNVIKEVIK